MPNKKMYGIVKVYGEKFYQTVVSHAFNSKSQYTTHLRDEGYIVRFVFSEMDYKVIARIISSRGFTALNDRQKEIYETYNELLPRGKTLC